MFQTLPNTGDPADYDAAKKALNAYFVPRKNAAFSRQTFHQLSQKEGETVLQFVTRLRRAARDCDFGGEKDNQIRDAVLSKCKSDYVRRKLLETELTLDKALQTADKCEKVEGQMAALSGKSKDPKYDSVNRVSDKKQKSRDKQYKPKTETKHLWSPQSQTGNRRTKPEPTPKGACYRCGRTGHFGRDSNCPARGQTCQKCSGRDHFAKMCKTKTKPRVNQVGEEQANPEASQDYAFLIREGPHSNMLRIKVGGVDLNMLIDSGATSNIINEQTWDSLKQNKIQCESHVAPPDRKLWAYGADRPLSLKGTFECEVQVSGRSTLAEFIVIKGKGVPLLGKDIAMKLGILQIGINAVSGHAGTIDEVKVDRCAKNSSALNGDKAKQYQQQFPGVFGGVGKLKTEQVKLHINTSVTPVAQPLRRTPFNLRSRVEQKIRELECLDIIEAVDGPTPWVNPVVVVPKPNCDIRLCLDMRRANEAIIRGRHPIPTVDELLQSMNGSKVFSKLDLKWGYHQLELATESRGITTFVTHCGLYQYKRLMFGVSSASEQYQYMIAKALAGLEGVENISDDIIVHGPDQNTHYSRVLAVLRRLQELGLTLNAEKCQFNMSRLVFMGILLSEKGIGPTQERVRAVSEFREPENVSEVRSFLGLVGFSSSFIPNFATLSDPLRKLTRKGVPFQFGPHQKAAFNALKESLAKATTLAYYDKTAPTKVIGDASPVGLGAVLVQEQRDGLVPICYVSRSLTDCERRYSQTEKEALSLVWACERFHAYIYGRDFELLTDHKPLEAIYGPRSKPCARIERWVLRLQLYNYKVVYVPGRENIADALSRLLSGKCKPEHAHGADEYVRFVAVSTTPRATTTKQVENASAEDVLVDYYSRYYEYQILSSTTTDKIVDSLEEAFSRHGIPLTLKSDNGPQFRSQEFRDFCEENGISHVRVTAKWAQANGEVERQNDSIMKRIRITQAAGQDWRKELRKYVAKYRATEHPATRKTPAELLFNRKIRGKLPAFKPDDHTDLEVRDHDAESKAKAKMYADTRRNTKYSDVQIGDQVLVRQEKTNKLSTPFIPDPFTVVSKTGNSVVVASPEGAQYSRNTSHVRKFTQSASDTGIKTASEPPTADSGGNTMDQAISPPKTVTHTPPAVTPPVAKELPSPCAGRPKRQCGMYPKFKDYILN
ncbi:uncharacterized protein K02A2.6-like [Patiria miniata]|uniref:RNA-directed DNA polymerase n=1 Tax=Patiria miniata TaxID=46514 RepID=A0A914A6P1_PATMI|nr:uncharacterized protein K02A2.6-like [Patiria miniata]